MTIPVKERQNRLRRRAASGDLLAPLDLLITRRFLVVVAVIRLPRLALIALAVVHLMIAPWTIIKEISPTRSLPSRGPSVVVAAGPPWRRS